MISAILASTPAGGIGMNGTLPWPRHSEDLRWFKEHTTNNIVVMGRNTWDDPMMPKPLPNRINCVVSNRVVNHVSVRRLKGNIKEEIVTMQSQLPNKDIFIIGGKSIYEDTESIVDCIYLTRMNQTWHADTYVNLDRMLSPYTIRSVRPGINCTYEIWIRKELW